MKTVYEMKKREFKKVPILSKKEINEKNPCGVIVMPTGKRHENGYGEIRLVFFDKYGVAIGAWNETSDVFHLKDIDSYLWTFDILPSGYLRVFCDASIPILFGGETYFSISPRVKKEEMEKTSTES